MKNSGVLLFAFKSTKFDYLKLAEWSAKNIKKYLNLPVCLVTDIDINDKSCFEYVIKSKPTGTTRFDYVSNESYIWNNGQRYEAFKLTPFQTTIVLDVDYVVASNQLLKLLDDPRDFICHGSSIDVTGKTPETPNFGKLQLPMAWATVIKFTKSFESELIFSLMEMIQKNYSHYANLYHFQDRTYRNDYALSIALYIAAGHRLTDEFFCSWPLFNSHASETVQKIDSNSYNIVYHKTVNKRQKLMRNTITDFDIHVMNKVSMEDIIEADL